MRYLMRRAEEDKPSERLGLGWWV